ncbi:MAG: energy transducer TonB [Aquificae bacterium]|nr:energy transducer TonB [Aquificota bacterium]
MADLKGKDKLFETGKKKIKEENKVSEKDILRYLRALERYLNNLARRKDLYPPMAKRLRLEGSLTVRFKLRKDGSVDNNSIKVMVSSGYSILDKGAVKLIKKYVPLFAKKKGIKPPKDNLTIELPITFEIIGW